MIDLYTAATLHGHSIALEACPAVQRGLQVPLRASAEEPVVKTAQTMLIR